MIASPLVVVIAAVFGSLVGSFLNVCIVRWPNDESIIRPSRSKCPKCGRQLPWYENIPVASWIALRGRCSGCGERISVQYPLIELATALIWAAAFAWPQVSMLTSVRLAVFSTVMLGVAVTDARFYVIPDGFTLFGVLFVFAGSIAAGVQGDVTVFASPWQALLGACVGAGAISITGWLGEMAFRKEAMGFGDTTLMAVCGAASRPERTLLNVFVAAALGALTFVLLVGPIGWMRARRAHREFQMPLVPFGVFLAPAAVVTLLYGERLMAWYAGSCSYRQAHLIRLKYAPLPCSLHSRPPRRADHGVRQVGDNGLYARTVRQLHGWHRRSTGRMFLKAPKLEERPRTTCAPISSRPSTSRQPALELAGI